MTIRRRTLAPWLTLVAIAIPISVVVVGYCLEHRDTAAFATTHR